VEHLVNLGGATKVVVLEREFVAMAAHMKTLEATLEKASKFVVDLSEYVSTLGASAPFASVAGGQQVQPSEFESFKKTCKMAFASLRQELKGGGIEVGGIVFEGEDACITFAREHLSMLPTYDCIPSMFYAMCMPSGEVVFKADMQGDEIHESRTGRNNMQPAVVMSVNTTIPPILAGLKSDEVRELKFDFNAARTYKEWLPASSQGGTCKNLRDGVLRAFERIKGAIAMTLGSGTARAVMTELHGEFLMHFRAIFLTEVSNYYLDILGKAGGTPPHMAEIKATCWALVTKLLRVLFKEVHGVRMHAAGLKHVVGDPARVNGLYLYAALEELRVLREFAAHDYRQHPKYNHFVTMNLFDTTLPRSVWEKRTDGAGRDMIRLTRLESVVTDQGAHIDRMETALGSVRQSLGLPAPVARNRRRAGAGGRGVTMADGVDVIE
jgi:hypothetical protein